VKEKMRDRQQWRLLAGRPRLTQGCSADWQAITLEPWVIVGMDNIFLR
jgi:hypothetical protein